MRFIKFMFLFLFFVLGLLFLVQNSEALSTPLALKLNLFTPAAQWAADAVPFYFVVVAAFGLGMLFTGVLFLFSQTRLVFSLSRQKRRVKTLDKEVARLQTAAEQREQERIKAEASADPVPAVS